MSDRKKAFWFIALLSVLVVVPFGRNHFLFQGGTAGGDCCPFYAGKWKLDTSGELWY